MSKILIENDTGEPIDFKVEVHYNETEDQHRVVFKKVSTGKPEPEMNFSVKDGGSDGSREIVLKVEHHRIPVDLYLQHDQQGGLTYRLTIGDTHWTHNANGLQGKANGKLTGIQLRTIAAVDQLTALLDDELYETIKCMSVLDDCGLIKMLHQAVDSDAQKYAHEDDPDADSVVQAVKAMTLFCYTEMVERGLHRPGQ